MSFPDQAAGRQRRFVSWFLAVVGLGLLAALTLPSNSATRMTGWPWWAAGRVLLLLPLAFLAAPGLLRGGSNADELPATPGRAWAWLLLMVAVIPVVSAMVSAHPPESLGTALIFVAAAALVWALGGWLVDHPRRRRQLGWVAAGFGAVFAVVSLVLWAIDSALPMWQKTARLNAQIGAEVFHLHPDGFRNNQPLGHSNYTAGVALLALPWVAWAAVQARRAGRVFWGALAALVFAVLLSSGSRGALLGLAAGGGFLVVLWARAARWPWRKTLLAGAGGVILLALLVAAVPRVRHSMVETLQGRRPTVGDQQRLAMLQIGTAMGAERWWIGQGPGLSTRLYPSYRDRVEGGVDMALQLHSTPVQLWAETGLPGLAAVTALVGLALVTAVRRVGEAGEAAAGSERSVIVAAAVSCAAYSGFAVTDYQFGLPVIAAFMAANLAVLAAVDAGRRRSMPARWPAAQILGVVALVGAGVVIFPEWRARGAFAAAVQDLEYGGDTETFNMSVMQAAAAQPDNPHVVAGGAAAHLRMAFLPTTEPDERNHHLAYASAFFEQALAIQPDFEFAHTNLAWLSLNRDPAQAAQHFRATLRVLPDRAGGYFGLGLARLALGDIDQARDAMALEIVNDPAFLTAPAWDTPALVEHREPVARRALAIATEFAARAPVAQAGEINYVCHLLRWWLGEDTAADVAAVASGPAAEFFASMNVPPSEPWSGVPTPTTPSWRVLQAAALAEPAARREILARLLFVRTENAASEPELEVLEKMLNRLGDDWLGWLQAPEGRQAPLVRTYRRDRIAYTILARNSDIPVARDAYLVQENRLVSLFFDYVFPLRGWAPDEQLLRYLAEHDL